MTNRETIDKDITLKNETIKFGLKLVVCASVSMFGLFWFFVKSLKDVSALLWSI
jgi:hypothetical protein